MTGNAALPFHSLTFTLAENKRPRAALRMTAHDGALYELHVEKGPASKPVSQFTRMVPADVAQRLKDALQEAGVFGWDESYGDASAPGSRKWSLQTVFKEGVFSVASKGGSDVPAGFDRLLEELYRLDFPRPEGGPANAGGRPATAGLSSALNALGSVGMGNFGGMSAGDLGAYGAVGGKAGGIDFSQLGDLLGSGDLQEAMAQLQRDPQALQRRMRDEFRALPPDEQESMIDALASLGTASRAWWEDFLRGN